MAGSAARGTQVYVGIADTDILVEQADECQHVLQVAIQGGQIEHRAIEQGGKLLYLARALLALKGNNCALKSEQCRRKLFEGGPV